jgi:hypothetical protein
MRENYHEENIRFYSVKIPLPRKQLMNDGRYDSVNSLVDAYEMRQ